MVVLYQIPINTVNVKREPDSFKIIGFNLHLRRKCPLHSFGRNRMETLRTNYLTTIELKLV